MESLIDSIIPIFGIVGVFGMPVFIVLIVLYFNNKKQAQFHASLQKLIDSGQTLSPELLRSLPGYKEETNEEKNDVRGGIILAGIGIGVVLLGLFGLDNQVVWASGLLVASIGTALLGYGVYATKKNLANEA